MALSDTEDAARWLETVGYYCLSAYWLPFELPPEDDVVRSKALPSGTQFDAIRDLKAFDRRLRLLLTGRSDEDRAAMGCPADWSVRGIWKE